MKQLSERARLSLFGYVQRLHQALENAPDLDAREVERDVLDHIEREIQPFPEPVRDGQLRPVLDRLGSPTQWVGVARYATGPALAPRGHAARDIETWVLAAMSFALFIGSGYVAARGKVELLAVCVIGAFIAARAAATNVDHGSPTDRGASDEPRTWVLTPALLLGYVTMAAVLLFWMVPAMVLLSYEVLRLDAIAPRFPDIVCDVAARNAYLFEMAHDPAKFFKLLARSGPWIFAPIGCWWIVLGILCRWQRDLFSWMFRPFLTARTTRVGGVLIRAGLIALALAAASTIGKHL